MTAWARALAALLTGACALAGCGGAAAAPLRPDRASCKLVDCNEGVTFKTYSYPRADALVDARTYGFYTCSDGGSYYVEDGAPVMAKVSLSYLGTSELTVQLSRVCDLDLLVLRPSGPRRFVHTGDPAHRAACGAVGEVVVRPPGTPAKRWG